MVPGDRVKANRYLFFLTPEYRKRLTKMIVAFGRWGRQPIDDVRQWPVSRLYRYFDMLQTIIKKEQHIET